MNKPNFHYMATPELLEVIGWSKHKFAHRLGVAYRTASRWTKDPPSSVREWLEGLAEYHWFHQKPRDWVDLVPDDDR